MRATIVHHQHYPLVGHSPRHLGPIEPGAAPVTSTRPSLQGCEQHEVAHPVAFVFIIVRTTPAGPMASRPGTPGRRCPVLADLADSAPAFQPNCPRRIQPAGSTQEVIQPSGSRQGGPAPSSSPLPASLQQRRPPAPGAVPTFRAQAISSSFMARLVQAAGTPALWTSATSVQANRTSEGGSLSSTPNSHRWPDPPSDFELLGKHFSLMRASSMKRQSTRTMRLRFCTPVFPGQSDFNFSQAKASALQQRFHRLERLV